MKRFFAWLAVAAIVCLSLSAEAQFLPSYTWVTNSSSGALQSVGVTITNSGASAIQPHSLTILAINTNQTFTLTYAYAIAGSTNTTAYNTITTNFTAGNGFTNGQNVTIQIPPVSQQVYFVPWGTFSCGIGYSNQVQFQ